MALEQVGVEAIAKGADKFVKHLRDMEVQYDKTVGRFRASSGQFVSANKVMNSFVDSMSKVAPTATSAAGGMGSLGASIAAIAGPAALAVGGLFALKKGFDLVTSAIKATASAVTGFISSGLQMAGTFQEMEFAALAVGRSMGLQREEIRGAIDDLNDAGIRYDVAAKTVGQFAKNQIDLAKATELANIAQGAAIFLGEDSTATMERLTHAIVSGAQETFRTMNITVRLGEEYEKFAKANDRTVESLTEQERVQIRVNAVIANSAALLDVYDAAMDSPTKKLRSLSGRELPALGAALGAPFLDAWSIAIQAVRDFVNALTDAMKEGGALYPILVNLGAVASIVAEGFANALGYVKDFVTGLRVDLDTGMSETVSGMLQWGVEMVAALAEGIVSAASTVLVGAMNFIGDVLTSWLAPGSAPKVAPGLIKWGLAAMSEYLHGFTLADFSVLEKIQAPLKQVLSGPAFADLSAEMIKAIGAGKVGEKMFERIAKAAGEFGTEIAQLARLQFQLAEATRQVAEAEKKVTDGRRKVADLTAEYNDLLRAGVSRDILKAKLAELNVAEEGVETAKAQRAEAKERIGSLEEEAKLQDKLVGQLIALGKAAMPPAVTTAAAAAAARMRGVKPPGVAEIAMPEIVLPTPAEFDITSRISEAIDSAKAAMKEKMAGLFQPFTDAWERMKTGPLAEIGLAFSKLWIPAKAAWDDFWLGFSPGWENMKITLAEFYEEIKPKLDEAWLGIRDLWDEAKTAALGLWVALGLVNPALDLNAETWGILAGVMAEAGLDFLLFLITEQVNKLTAGINALNTALDWLKEKTLDAVGSLNQTFEDLKAISWDGFTQKMIDAGLLGESEARLATGIRSVIETVGELAGVTEGFFAFQQMRADLEQLVTVTIPAFVLDTVRKFVELKDKTIQSAAELTTRIIQLFRQMAARVVGIMRGMTARVLAALAQLRDGSEEILMQIAEIFELMAERMAEAVLQITSEIDKLHEALSDLIDKAEEAKNAMEDAGLIGASPSRLELGLRGAAQAMRQLATIEMPKLSAAMTRVGGPTMAHAPVAAAGGMAGASVTVPITANIYNDLDAEAFYIRVEQAVTRAVARRW